MPDSSDCNTESCMVEWIGQQKWGPGFNPNKSLDQKNNLNDQSQRKHISWQLYDSFHFWLTGGRGKSSHGSLRLMTGIMAVCLVVIYATFSGNLIASLTGSFLPKIRRTNIRKNVGTGIHIWKLSVTEIP